MSFFKSYILGAAAALALAGISTGCQNDFDSYVPVEPVASLKPNMSILDVKTEFWNDETNYIDTIGVTNGVADDKDYIISGRVVSSDEAGNVFKSLVIQDETAALAISINSYNLYLKYRIGQEIVINLKGMYIGKYNGLQQLGMPEWYESGKVWEATFMAPEFFESRIELNGFPKPELVDTVEVNSFDELTANPDILRRYQSRIVKFNNVYFQNGGDQQFSEYHSSGVNQVIIDSKGASLPVRTSGYSNFWNKYLPEGNGDVVCILSYYGTTGWQLILNDYEGCMNFGNPTVAPGVENNPYTVPEVIGSISNDKPASGWVEGYIVGAVAPEVESVQSNSDVEWSADVVLDNTLVIGASADTKDISEALVISLPAGSALRQYGNLADNPSNYKKKIKVKGKFGTYMGTFGVLDNTGKANEFSIEGVEPGGPAGNGTEAAPYNVGQVIAMNPQGGKDNPDEKDVWVTGYIVGWADLSTTYVINASTAKFTVPATANTNMLIAASPDVKDFSECLGIQLPTGIRAALNLVDNPGNLGKQVKLLGNICKYSGVPGMRDASKYVLDGSSTPDTPDTPGTDAAPAGDGTAASPYNAARALELAQGLTADDKLTDKYVTGVVTAIKELSTSFGNATYTIGDEGYTSTFSVFRGYYFNGDKFTDANQLKVGDKVVVKGTIVNYMGNTPQITQGSEIISINGKTEAGGGDTPENPDKPDQPVTGNTPDFNTFNGGQPNTTVYGTYTTATGWTADWALILNGGQEATNFISTDDSTLFPVIDGTPKRPGKLTSPTISGGIKTLSFSYGFPYNETKVGFTVNIKQDGAVVASDKVVVDPATKAKVYTYTHDFNVSGNFVIEIVNDLVTNSSSNNKDRLAIWNLSWSN